MNVISRTFFAILLVTLLAACGGEPETAQPESADVAAVVEAEETEVIKAEEAAMLEAVEESISESEADAAIAEAEEAIVIAESTTQSVAAASADWKYSPDKHFMKFTTAQGTSSPPDVIEVAEVFWYGCSHCYNFEPYVKKWKDGLPDDVRFVRVPVMWNPTNQIHARLFYTAEALGKQDEMHDDIFREFHVNRNTLDDEEKIREFFKSFGVSEEDFNNAFRSFAVESKLKRARNLTQRYQITSVPILVTNGKYLAKGDGVRTFDDMLSVTDELVERERQPL